MKKAGENTAEFLAEGEGHSTIILRSATNNFLTISQKYPQSKNTRATHLSPITSLTHRYDKSHQVTYEDFKKMKLNELMAEISEAALLATGEAGKAEL